MKRRELLEGLVATAALTAVGCGKDSGRSRADSSPSTSSGSTTTPSTGSTSPGGTTTGVPYEQCPSGGLDATAAFQEIDTFVILCLSGRSFDHYLGSLSLEGMAVDGLTGAETNPDAAGDPTAVFRLDDATPAAPPDDWGAAHAQWNDGANDGFVTAHAGPDEDQVMGYYERDQLPALYALADVGAVCDRYFSSVMGPMWPNRCFLHAAGSDGQMSDQPVVGLPTLWDRLADDGVAHANYFHDIAWRTAGMLAPAGDSDFLPIDDFFTSAASGTLPRVSVIDPAFLTEPNDDRAPHHIVLGQALLAAVVTALGQSPQWDRCLFVVTYDNHGGFYDHVPPPLTTDDRPEFEQLGFRVPTVVVGPTVKRGCAVSTQYDHVSLLSTLTRRFDLTPLNDRVSATNDLRDCIHPDFLGDPQPAPTMPVITVPMTALGRNPALDAVLRHGEQLGVVELVG